MLQSRLSHHLDLRPQLKMKFGNIELRTMSLRGGEANEAPRPKTSHVIAVGTICGAILILNEMNLVTSNFLAISDLRWWFPFV